MFTVILTVILIMPGEAKDITQARPMPSMSECWETAAAWVAQDAKAAGAEGFAAGCSVTPTPGRDG